MKTPFLIGRLVFGGYFLYSGINHFLHHKMMAEYTKAKGVPAPDAAVLVTGAALTLGGASVLLGVKPKLGALALIGFLAGVSPIMHDFWRQEDPQQKQNEMINFGKNMALLGGTMALMAVEEPWPVSIEGAKQGRVQRIVRRLKQEVAA